MTDPAKREALRREAERWIKALRLNTTADEVVARGLEMPRALRDSGAPRCVEGNGSAAWGVRRGVCGEDAEGAGGRRALAGGNANGQGDKDLRREVRLR